MFLSFGLLKAQGVLKDISVELLKHLDQGTAFIQVSTKLNPRGEIRGQVCTTLACSICGLFFFWIFLKQALQSQVIYKR